MDEASGQLSARFDHDPTRIDALLTQDDGAGRVAMLTDALGSVYGLADDAATLRARYGYDVYGARSATLEEIATRWGFTGRREDGQAELLYLRAREYDQSVGRFLQPDPLGQLNGPAGVSSLYEYVRARPTALTDPSGLLGQSFIFGALAGAGAGEMLEFFASGVISGIGDYLTMLGRQALAAGVARGLLCLPCERAAIAAFGAWVPFSRGKSAIAASVLGLRRLAQQALARLSVDVAGYELTLLTSALVMQDACPDVTLFLLGAYYEVAASFDFARALN